MATRYKSAKAGFRKATRGSPKQRGTGHDAVAASRVRKGPVAQDKSRDTATEAREAWAQESQITDQEMEWRRVERQMREGEGEEVW